MVSKKNWSKTLIIPSRKKFPKTLGKSAGKKCQKPRKNDNFVKTEQHNPPPRKNVFRPTPPVPKEAQLRGGPPLNLFRASASASMDSMSRWLVGSSNSSRHRGFFFGLGGSKPSHRLPGEGGGGGLVGLTFWVPRILDE